MSPRKAKGRRPSPTPTITVHAGDLPRVLEAIDGLHGARTVSLAVELFRFRKTVAEAHSVLAEQLKPLVDLDAKGLAPGSIKILDTKLAEANALLTEKLELPCSGSIKLSDLAELKVERDWHLGLLMEIGMVEGSA